MARKEITKAEFDEIKKGKYEPYTIRNLGSFGVYVANEKGTLVKPPKAKSTKSTAVKSVMTEVKWNKSNKFDIVETEDGKYYVRHWELDPETGNPSRISGITNKGMPNRKIPIPKDKATLTSFINALQTVKNKM